MTHEEIDKWVEEHVQFHGDWTDEVVTIKEDILKWAKKIAHKFYELGCKAGAEAFKQSLNMY